MIRLHCIVSAGALMAFAQACGSNDEVPSKGEPSLVAAEDQDPDPRVIEVSLRAELGSKHYAGARETAVWTYGGTIPGPLIQGHVGDDLIVHFDNQLPEETTIHWHGVRLPATMDGTLAMQSPIPPGGNFEYAFPLKDAGLFWFHPHIRSDVQVEKGLYGILRVTGEDEPAVDEERILVLDDVGLLDDGSLPTYLDDESKMLGRQGNVLLVNGQPMPVFEWQAGVLSRLLIVNVANGRFFNLSLPGYRWHVIGTDGGWLPQPYDTERLLIAPGERYDVTLIVSGQPGSEVTLTNEPYERGHDTGLEPPLAMATFRINQQPPLTGRVLPARFPDMDRLENGPVDNQLVLDEGLVGGELMFSVNGATYPNVPPITVPVGDVRRFEVRNDSEMDHPFHLHGTYFQVLSRDGVPTPDALLANKDTVIVPRMGRLTFAAPFDEAGRWMYHCHIFEHAEFGMMGEVTVVAPD